MAALSITKWRRIALKVLLAGESRSLPSISQIAGRRTPEEDPM